MSMRFSLEALSPAMRQQAERQLRGPVAPSPMPKYRNKKCEVDGHKFDSHKEAERWGELRLMERAKQINKLRRQVPFRLTVNGHLICTYIADFVYYTAQNRLVVEDVKGYRKGQAYRIFKLKAALMLAVNRIAVTEV